MALDRDLLDLLICPETREKLGLAGPALLEKVNEAIQAGKLRNRAGRAVGTPLEAGLVRPDGKVLYPVYDGIPNLLLDEAISIEEV
jgi:uncharacterized protein YbaR (Trm112 family)